MRRLLLQTHLPVACRVFSFSGRLGRTSVKTKIKIFSWRRKSPSENKKKYECPLAQCFSPASATMQKNNTSDRRMCASPLGNSNGRPPRSCWFSPSRPGVQSGGDNRPDETEIKIENYRLAGHIQRLGVRGCESVVIPISMRK